MEVYCTNCGETIDDSLNFCPHCGISLTEGSSETTNEWSNTAKTAATVGGAVLGAYALSGLLHRRRRPPHHPPHHHHGPHGHGHGPGGHGHR